MTKKINKTIGLGDAVAIATKITGVKTAVKIITKAVGIEDCGCDERQEKLNNWNPFGNGSK